MSRTSNLPESTRSVLDELRSRIRAYVFWEGCALIVVVLGALFWGSFVIDWAYFRVSHLELPRWFRAGVLLAGIVLIAGGAFSWIVLRMFRRLHARSLALVLERRFPELDDRFVTAVEAAEGLIESNSPVTDAMLQRTLTDVSQMTKQLDLGSVFDNQPLRRASIVAVGLVTSVLGLMVVDSAGMERWVSGFLRLQEGYWPRETELVVHVVVQPGDQLRDFVDGHYQHPKGGDLVLSIEVPKGKSLPDRIRIDSRTSRGLSQIYVIPSSDQVFRHTFVGVLEDMKLWVSGGDFSHVRPYAINVVPPPEVKQILLHSLYPAYTGLNRKTVEGIQRTPIDLKGSQLSLPMQTDVVMDITSNKPLHRMRIEGDAGTERWELEMQSDSSRGTTAKILLKSHEGRPQLQLTLPDWTFSSSDTGSGPMTFSLPFVLEPDGATKLPDVLRKSTDSGQPLVLPLPLPPDSLLRITLEDTDGIMSPTPIRFMINSIVDQPPVVETKLKGIGTTITRKARIPIAGTILDDYGVTSAQFEFRIEDATEWQSRPLAVVPAGAPREFTLQRNDNEPFERFDVLSLDLALKQRLTLTVAAFDGCTVPTVATTNSNVAAVANGAPKPAQAETAHHSQGLKYVFTVISEDELRSMLYGRELGLRKRMEQIIAESKTSLKDLQTQRDKLAELQVMKSTSVPPEDERWKTITLGMNATADRTLHGIRKNAVESAGIETAFVEIREELINNAADSPAMLERLSEKILAPLHRINAKNYPTVDGTLGLFKLALDKNTDPKVALETSIDETVMLIQNLEQILNEMAELARYDALVEELKKMIKSMNDVRDETKRKIKEKAIQALE